MRGLHWAVHSNGRLEVDVHGLDAVELRGFEDAAVIAGGDDAPGAVVRPRLCALPSVAAISIAC